jgi:hypothetical protein
MIGTLITLVIAAAGALVWLFLSRRHPQQAAENLEDVQATGDVRLEEASITVTEADGPSEASTQEQPLEEPVNQSVRADSEAELHRRSTTEDEQLIEAAGLHIEVPPLTEHVPDREPELATSRTSHAEADDAALVLLSESPTGDREHLPIANTASGNGSHIQMAAEGAAAVFPETEPVETEQIAAAVAPAIEIVQPPESVFVHGNGGSEQTPVAEPEGVEAEGPCEPATENRLLEQPADQSAQPGSKQELQTRATAEEEQLTAETGLSAEVPLRTVQMPDHEPELATCGPSCANADEAAPVLLAESHAADHEEVPASAVESGNGSRGQTVAEEAVAVLFPETADVETTQNAPAAALAIEIIQLPEGGFVHGNGGEQRASVAEPATEDVEEALRTPKRYRPPSQKPPRQKDSQDEKRESNRASPEEATASIRVRLTFDRAGFCNFSLLPERTSGMDDEVSVILRGQQTQLLGQEVWYEDLPFSDTGMELRKGLEVKGRLADGRRARWLLTGRDLYVLASHPRATGFVSTDRLALGRSHVVLCVAEIAEAVEAILNEACCTGSTKLDETLGVPSGWIALRDVSPTKAIALNSGIDHFYAIKPAPDIEIDLQGGLRLRNSIWLAGYAPRVTLLGESNVPVRVWIDGKEALRSEEGSLTAEGYDLVGEHSVYCEGLSCSASYAIEEPPESWEQWSAYSYGKAAICGPLTQVRSEAAERRIVTAPMSNPLLLGASPGMIFYCSRRNVARWKGYVPFDPVWALPAHPLTSNKREASIIQLADMPVVSVNGPYSKAALSWSNAILDASRKGLRIANESPQSKASWSTYKKVARSIWRRAR